MGMSDARFAVFVFVHIVEVFFSFEKHSRRRTPTSIVGRFKNLKINSAIHIVGRPDVPKEKIVVVGGIKFEKEIQGPPLPPSFVNPLGQWYF